MEWEWFSVRWFNPLNLLGFEWGNAYFLYLLLLIPFLPLLKRLLYWKNRSYVEIATFQGVKGKLIVNVLRFVPLALQLMTLVSLAICLARPYKNNQQVIQNSEGIDILVVLDVSESMLEKDMQPNRLEAAKNVASQFIKGRVFDRIGIVVFSGEAFSLSPLTTDYQLLTGYINEINQQMIPQPGTAIGNAIGVATNRLKESASKTKVIILISDGDNTAGSLDPETSAQLASSYGIKIYSILIGNAAAKLQKDSLNILSSFDEKALINIAKIGEGQYFRANDNQSLIQIFNKIDTYEKTTVFETKYTTKEEFYMHYLKWSVLFLLLWLFAKGSSLSNILED